jgi:hypothetical protein
VGGRCVCGGGGSPPQINDPVGLKLRAVGLKIVRLFTCSALRRKLNIFETRDRLRLLSIELEIFSNRSNSSEASDMKKYYVLISRVYERIIIQNTRAKGRSFHLLSKHGDIYVSRLRVGTFIWNLGSARSFTGDILY